jgi:hypothetical protein
MSQTELELMHRARAKRYAELEAKAAATDERIKELTEKLETAEWLARSAQDQAASVDYNPMLGKVWTAGMDEPTEDQARALLDLNTGQVFIREHNCWIKGGRSASGQTRYEWPIGEDYGPFIPFIEGWGFDSILKSCAEQDTREEILRRFIYGKDGYNTEGVWSRPELTEAYKRVVTELESKHAKRLAEVRALEDRFARMYYACLSCGASYVNAEELEHVNGCSEPDTVRFERVP